MAIAITLQQYLADHRITYDECRHEHTSTAAETAHAAHVPGDNVVKAVLLVDGNEEYLLAVLPASHELELPKLKDLFDHDYILADEQELKLVFKDCELGAVPPVGEAYSVDVVLDNRLKEMENIFFEAGDHATLVHMKGADFHAMMHTVVHADISHHI